jgi:mono/diheme cytochrome c family protein
MKISTSLRWAAALASAGLLWVPAAHAATPAELLAAYAAKAGATPSAERGQKLFTTDFGRQMGFRCASCHGPVPLGRGKDEVSEKPIAPLAPAANPARFTDKAKVENAFRMNCKDVVGRECTALEKADVMTWLLSLKP